MSEDRSSDEAATADGVGPDGRAGSGDPMPDPNATGTPEGLAGGAAPADADGPAREAREREAARRRGTARQQARESARAAAHSAGRWEVEPPRRQVERRAIRASERAFSALSENVRDYAVFLVDPDGIITYWGEGAHLIKWWTKDEAEGGHLRFLYPDGGAEDGTAEAHLADAARHGEYVGEGQRIRQDGSTFWAGVTLTALRDEDGTLLGFAKVTRDLTARRAADAALVRAAAAERAHATAEAVSTARGQFIATMSHEIRTPINAVLGYADLLDAEVEGPLTDGQRRYVERLRTSGRHLLSLVEEVLDLSRLDADRAPVERAAGRVGDVVAAAVALLEPQARQRGVDLIEDLSAHGEGLSYWGDEARVRQILVNLLANAVKFTEARDGAPGRVTVSAGAGTQPASDVDPPGEGPWVYVRVKDTGPGIAAEQREAIFQPFVQLGRRSNNPVSGAGLGLTISRRLAQRMGGEISVDSTIGVGSTFVLWLPIAPLESLRTGGGA